MHLRPRFLALATVGAVICTAGFIPSVSQAAGGSGGSGGEEEKRSYAATHGLTTDDVSSINALNERALTLGRSGKPPVGAAPSAGPSFRAPRSVDDRETPPAEPLDKMPAPYRAYGGRATTVVNNYIRKWQQVYSQRDGKRQQMTEEQREKLSYGCVGITWANSGPYPTNRLAFAYFDENKYRNTLKNTGPQPGETRAEFEGRAAKESFDEEKGFQRAREVASLMNKALEDAHDEGTYIDNLKRELSARDDALLHEDSRSNFFSALRNTPSFKERDGGNHDPSRMKAVIYSKHFWSGQDGWGSSDTRKYGDPDAFRPDRGTGLVDMSRDRNIPRSPAGPGEAWVNFDYGWFGAQTVADADKTVWTHGDHYHAPHGELGPMHVYESKFRNWSAGYADFDRGAYMITFIPKSWNTAPAEVKQGWP
ncbi:protein-glutamine gamma-glutamyltransferase [Streptomyces caatingaensis]|uniref:Protein-glutamine gamma-glutamyltransferase n=1 Tax=Streptomyces caatingaensis TaxID=1678637 RepID=A0A0K9XB95_9ACTN|nr:protein-glutamine gamma-glutamyltransferase [Streptomyces caatingaensis]KNB49937.1 protein-glutamine gamma-glutamyltransferase [Streptomyces caatingaensis]